jgi:hypothetical protein
MNDSVLNVNVKVKGKCYLIVQPLNTFNNI